MSVIKLTIRSPNNDFNGLDIEAENHWQVKDLKLYIQQNHSNGQTIESQRIVFSGRLLRDDEEIRELFSSSSQSSHIIHVIFSLKSSQESYSKEDVEELKKEYLEYLKEFYSKNINPSTQYASLFNINDQLMQLPQQQQQQEPIQNDTVNDVPIRQNQPGLLRRLLPAFLIRNADPQGDGGVDEFDIFVGLFRLFVILVASLSYFEFSKIIALLVVVFLVYLFRLYNSFRELNRVINRLHERNVVQIHQNDATVPDEEDEEEEVVENNRENIINRQNLTLSQTFSYYTVTIIHTIWSYISTIIPEDVPEGVQ